MPTTLFFDECGFTGEDLAQVDQPVLVVASHDIDDEEARALKERHFGHVRAEELKHSSLQRRSQHQAAVASLLGAVFGADRARVSLAHKPFALIAKIVDLLVEPMMHRDGIDLYEGGGNDALANVLYYSLGAHSQNLLLEVAKSFQRAARTRRPEYVNECNQLLLSEEVSAALDGSPPLFPATLARGGRDWAKGLAERSLDLSLPLALQQCWAWRNRGPGPFNIVHDRSSAMAKSKWLWDAIVAPDAPEALVGRGWFTVQYPLGVLDTRFEDSKESPSLQIADVVAGAFGRWATWLARGRGESDSYALTLDAVIQPALERVIAGVVWPTPSVERGPSTPAGVADPNDYLTSIVRKIARS